MGGPVAVAVVVVAAGAVRAGAAFFAGACLGAGFALERIGFWGFLAARRGARDWKVRGTERFAACREAWGLKTQTRRLVAGVLAKADMANAQGLVTQLINYVGEVPV